MRTQMFVFGALVLGLAGRAHAQAGWEAEWQVKLVIVDATTSGAELSGDFGVKQVIERAGDWIVSSDDVHRTTEECPQLVLAQFPNIASEVTDEPRKCWKGLVELKSAVQVDSKAEIAAHMTELHDVIDSYLQRCAGHFPCLIDFPYYKRNSDALARTDAVPNKHWYVEIDSGQVKLSPQLNVNVPLAYFATPQKTGANRFIDDQFQELWSDATPLPWLLRGEREAFYRLFAFYAKKMDMLADRGHELASKNMLNPNPKFDFCQLRDAMGYWKTLVPLSIYFRSPGSYYKVQSATPRQVLSDTPQCPFTTRDVGLLPMYDASGRIKPVFEFRHPGPYACFELIEQVQKWAQTGAQPAGFANTAAECERDLTTF